MSLAPKERQNIQQKKVQKKPNKSDQKPPTPLLPLSPLIRFDKKVKIFLITLLAIYFLASILKLHTSSIVYWDRYYGAQESGALLMGEPKLVRADEWRTMTPALVGQYKAGMPISNPAFGGGNTPVVWGFPVKDMSALLRPAVWSFFIFDVERAFSFSWNFSIFFFLISTFLLLMLLTGNNFWISVFGSFFIFLSPGIQWWSYYIATYMLYMNGMIVSFIYLLYANRKLTLLTAGIVLLISTYGYLFNLYPPFQVPLIYLYLFIFLGFILKTKNLKLVKNNLYWKLGVLAGVLILFSIFTYHYYVIAKDSYAAMLNTVYPGKRVAKGGDLVAGKFFSEFFGPFMEMTHVPAKWMNISEASGLIMFFPILFYVMGYEYFKFKKIDWLQISLSVFLIISFVYILIGFPAFINKLTLFSMAEARRFLPIAEIGNILLLACVISDNKLKNKFQFSWVEFAVLSVAIIAFFVLVTNNINKVTDNFFTESEVMKVVTLFTLIYLLIRYKYVRFVTPALCLLLLAVNISNATVNPLTSGLSPILENPVIAVSKEIHDKDPKAGWVVFGEGVMADLLKANGMNVLNGVKFIPTLNEMKVLDPENKSDSIYNRFAHVYVSTHINWKDSVNILLVNEDGFVIQMDPCSPRLKQLGIKYFIFSYVPTPEEVRCMTLISKQQKFSVYKRNDE